MPHEAGNLPEPFGGLWHGTEKANGLPDFLCHDADRLD
jgi:hypothetical protein